MPKIHPIRYAKTPSAPKSGTETITAALINSPLLLILTFYDAFAGFLNMLSGIKTIENPSTTEIRTGKTESMVLTMF